MFHWFYKAFSSLSRQPLNILQNHHLSKKLFNKETPKAKATMAQRTSNKLATWFPQAQHPIIISAPMLGTSNATLAVEVSKAGGIGAIFPTPFHP